MACQQDTFTILVYLIQLSLLFIFQTKNSPLTSTGHRAIQLYLTDFIILLIYTEAYKSWSSSIHNELHQHVTIPLLCPNFLLSFLSRVPDNRKNTWEAHTGVLWFKNHSKSASALTPLYKRFVVSVAARYILWIFIKAAILDRYTRSVCSWLNHKHWDLLSM